ncbi:hypothetical protein [Echinimonas agarilytica]|uniref:Aminoglycoside phosphotransferase domain-containing protein n=1 Tax=Echinimonas agarilytica TaxID=1215918 RepID=A0AA41WBY7_9GAMM|nr:hypothetical protein [Echinimonas agarilytica]MCM2681381.1 hypothetical protein [Echinimonas agarilytica]
MLTPEQCLKKSGLQGDWVIRSIDQGLSHSHYKVVAHEGREVRAVYAMRIYQTHDRPWLDHSHELNVLTQASNLGLAPQLIYRSADDNFFISEFIEHRPLKVCTEGSALSFEQGRLLLAQLRQMTIERKMSMAERYTQYVLKARQLRPSVIHDPKFIHVCSVADRALSVLNLSQWQWQPVFLDWHEQNLLYTPQNLYLIDYEYCCLSALPLEMASLYESRLFDDHQWHQLKQWMEVTYNETVSELQLHAARILYLAMCYVWYIASDVNAEQDFPEILARIARLTEDK